MKRPDAAIRSMIESETRLVRRCRCMQSVAQYVGRWTELFPASRAYRAAGGRDKRYTTEELLCLYCAKKWAKANDLKLYPSPLPDPAPGQRWRSIRYPDCIVTITGFLDDAFGKKQIVFEPPIPNGDREISSVVLPTLIGSFEPVCEQMTPLVL